MPFFFAFRHSPSYLPKCTPILARQRPRRRAPISRAVTANCAIGTGRADRQLQKCSINRRTIAAAIMMLPAAIRPGKGSGAVHTSLFPFAFEPASSTKTCENPQLGATAARARVGDRRNNLSPAGHVQMPTPCCRSPLHSPSYLRGQFVANKYRHTQNVLVRRVPKGTNRVEL